LACCQLTVCLGIFVQEGSNCLTFLRVNSKSGEALAHGSTIPHQFVEKIAPQSVHVYKFLFSGNNWRSR
jgi:hypothetical protein